MAQGTLDPTYKPKLSLTKPVHQFGPFPQWFDEKKIVSMDPLGHDIVAEFGNYLDKGTYVHTHTLWLLLYSFL